MSGGIGDTGDNIDLLVETRVNQSLSDVLADAETGIVDGDVVDDAVWAGDVDVPEESQGERGAYSKMQGLGHLSLGVDVDVELGVDEDGFAVQNVA